MLKQGLQQKLGLKINPLQIQLIKLLELPTYQLEQRIKEELEQNPLLEEGEEEHELSAESSNEEDSPDEREEYESEEEEERGGEDEFSLEDYMGDDSDDIPEYRLSSSNASREDENRDFIVSQGASFRESLIAQLGTRTLTEEDRHIAE